MFFPHDPFSSHQNPIPKNNEGESTIHVTAFAANELESISRDPGRLGVPPPRPSAYRPPPPAPVFAPPAPSPPRAHSIHVDIVETSFVSQKMETALIVSDGARLESTQVVFEDNAAGTMIKSESEGTVVMSSTAFRENEIKGKGGNQALVVLEGDSDMDVGEDALATNCVGGAEPAAVAASVRCAGISTGGRCQALGDDCSAVSAVAAAAVPEEDGGGDDGTADDGDGDDGETAEDGEDQMAASGDPPPEEGEDGDAASEDGDPPMEPLEDDVLIDGMFDEMGEFPFYLARNIT